VSADSPLLVEPANVMAISGVRRRRRDATKYDKLIKAEGKLPKNQ
jgi:hypothetical protein